MSVTNYGPHLVRINVCCNDPDNGNFDARAAGLSLQDGLAELTSFDMRGPTFREHPDHIQISRRRFRCAQSKEWYGNWCWNAYWLDVDDAVEMLAYVHQIDLFNCDMADERVFARWRSREPFTESDREFLARQLVKADLAERARR